MSQNSRSSCPSAEKCFVYPSLVEHTGKFDYRLARGASPGVSPADYEVALVGLADVFSFEGGALELNLDPDLMSVLVEPWREPPVSKSKLGERE